MPSTDSLGCLVGAEGVRSKVMRALEVVEWDVPGRCLCHLVQILTSSQQTREVNINENYVLTTSVQGDVYSGQVQNSGAIEGPSSTVSSLATAVAALLRLMERTLCPHANSNQLFLDAAKPSQAQKATSQGTRAAPATTGKPPGQLPVWKHTPPHGAPWALPTWLTAMLEA